MWKASVCKAGNNRIFLYSREIISIAILFPSGVHFLNFFRLSMIYYLFQCVSLFAFFIINIIIIIIIIIIVIIIIIIVIIPKMFICTSAFLCFTLSLSSFVISFLCFLSLSLVRLPVCLSLIDWWTDFNCMSTCQGLFYTKRLGNRVYCTFMFTFLCIWFLRLFCRGFLRIHIFLNGYMRLIGETQTSTITQGQSGPGSNGLQPKKTPVYLEVMDCNLKVSEFEL